METKVADILKKYGNNSRNLKNSFINQIGSYQSDEVNKEIEDFKLELRKQQILSEQFNEGDQSMLDNCKNINSQSAIITKQADNLEDIGKQLREIILSNKEKANINSELNELINSEEYNVITGKLRSIKTNIQKIKSFLIDEGIHDF